jgi:hypothetical protein
MAAASCVTCRHTTPPPAQHNKTNPATQCQVKCCLVDTHDQNALPEPQLEGGAEEPDQSTPNVTTVYKLPKSAPEQQQHLQQRPQEWHTHTCTPPKHTAAAAGLQCCCRSCTSSPASAADAASLALQVQQELPAARSNIFCRYSRVANPTRTYSAAFTAAATW